MNIHVRVRVQSVHQQHAHMISDMVTPARIDDVYIVKVKTRMWANAQPDGRPVEHGWHPLFNAAKFG